MQMRKFSWRIATRRVPWPPVFRPEVSQQTSVQTSGHHRLLLFPPRVEGGRDRERGLFFSTATLQRNRDEVSERRHMIKHGENDDERSVRWKKMGTPSQIHILHTGTTNYDLCFETEKSPRIRRTLI